MPRRAIFVFITCIVVAIVVLSFLNPGKPLTATEANLLEEVGQLQRGDFLDRSSHLMLVEENDDHGGLFLRTNHTLREHYLSATLEMWVRNGSVVGYVRENNHNEWVVAVKRYLDLE
jgi:hypothetical protein